MEAERELVRKYIDRAVSEEQGYLITYYRQGDDGAVGFMSGYIMSSMRRDGVTAPHRDVVDALVREVFEEHPRVCIDDCNCESGTHGPHLGFLHVCAAEDGPGAEGARIERCEVCQTLSDDEGAIALHAKLCGCRWGEPCPKCGEGLRICWAGGADLHCDACGAVVSLATERS
jgi:hypothetical protein